MGRLTVRRTETLKAPGRYGDGNGLYLFVQKSGARSWVQRIMINGVRRDIGLGSARFVTLAEARDAAYDNKRNATRGGDPFAASAKRRIPTFRVCCERAAEGRDLKGRGVVDRQKALDRFCAPLMDRRVDQIGREDVLRCLTPIWTTRNAMARKVRTWIRAALSWAMAHGHVDLNVAGEAIDGALPQVKANSDHHAALPYDKVGEALAAIDASGGAPAVRDCLRFTALTAVRSGEARAARWDEIDLDSRE